ncbi:MAG: cation-translocating P-type ATPase [Anaerolineae bacterium]|nr:cation-translocating P-type ATPase [Anaerolineae bacterium]
MAVTVKSGAETSTSPGSGPVWYTIGPEETLGRLETTVASGLSSDAVAERLEQYGPNELIDRGIKSPWAILWEQLTNPLVLLLLGAALVSIFLGKFDSVIAIMAIVVINAILGVSQEYRAEQAIAALKKMAAPLVRVRRNGAVADIESRDLVPGDIVLLEAGTIIPADARLVEAANVQVAEAALTGESQPVDKSIRALESADVPVADRTNMVYMGTAVTYGRGTAVVVDTGMKTELGRIANLIQSVEEEKTPMQKRMDEVGIALFRLAIGVMIFAFIVGVLTGQPILPQGGAGSAEESVLLTAVSIAVAVVPEGLPAVVTVALALGAQRMLRKRALIRKLPAVETLGSVTTICSDKTGTLTENRMTVRLIDVAGNVASLEEVVDDGRATFLSMNGSTPQPNVAQAMLLTGNALCNDAVLQADDNGTYMAIGDPTEGALLVAAARYNLYKMHLDEMFPRVAEVPFSSERKRMSTIHRSAPFAGKTQEEQTVNTVIETLMLSTEAEWVAVTKGGVDSVLEVSDRVWMEGAPHPLTDEVRARILKSNDELASNGLRVLGMGFRRLKQVPDEPGVEDVEHNLIFLGMVGIIDPPRPEVKVAVHTAREAGIRPVMITGDHPMTAFSIARELNIAKETDRVVTGQELQKMSQEELESLVETVPVFARVAPEHKLRIVTALQSKGHIVAMTGDGVNDAPALKKADIGVAMGITGTAVSKEASSMVILDDNFATIVAAVEEGRTIFENVRRFIKYLVASNTGELFVLIMTQLISGMTLPLTTLQILWMNLITDGVPALALGVEQGERNAMKRPPYPPNMSMFGMGMTRHIAIVGLTLGLTGIALGYWAWSTNVLAANGNPAWNTMVFIFLTIAQMGHAWGLRSHRESTFTLPFFSNPLLLGAVVFTVVVQLLVVYMPFFNNIFGTNPLTGPQLLLCMLLSTIVFIVVELEKLLIRRGVLH